MYLSENMLLQDLEDEEENYPIYRVLKLHPNGIDIAVIDIHKRNAEVVWWHRGDTELEIEQAIYRIIKFDPYSKVVQRMDDDLTKSEIEDRDKNFVLLLPVIVDNHGMTIYYPKQRSKLFAQIYKETGTARSTLYFLTRRWLQRGQVKNALIPDHHHKGERGKSKMASPNSPKLGRSQVLPKSSTSNPRRGINVTPLIRNLLIKGANEFYVRGGFNFKTAYEKTIEKYFNAGYEELDGIQIPIPLPVDQRPTYDQFYYWYNKDRDPEYERKHRNKNYNLEYRPIKGDIFMIADKPGHSQIDVVNIPAHLVSPFYPEKIVGTAKAAVIVDSFSLYLMGFAISHGNESWMLNASAILNAASDKVEFCAEYGIAISPEDWKCQHLPYSIIGDNGPLESYHAGSFGNDMGIVMENTPPYRPDLKGIIERFFWHFITDLFHKVKIPGFKVPRERGDKDYVLDAALTMFELTQIFIQFVIWFNNHREMEKYPLTREMTMDGVQPYPAQVWDWGVENLSGELRVVEGSERTRVKLALLPRGKASVDRKGILFQGLHFKNDEVERNYTVRDPGRKKPRFEISYDPRTVNYVYVREDAGRIVKKCYLSQRREDQIFLNMSWDEVFEYRRIRKSEKREHSTDNQINKSSLYSSVEKIAQNAVQRRHAATEGLSKATRKANISENRSDAKKVEDERALMGKSVPAPDEFQDDVENQVDSKDVTFQPSQLAPTEYIGAPKRKKPKNTST